MITYHLWSGNLSQNALLMLILKHSYDPSQIQKVIGGNTLDQLVLQ